MACSIEVLTPQNVNEELWMNFCQEITDEWMKICRRYGVNMGMRPHWAKNWEGLKIDLDDDGKKSVPIEEYLREIAYKDQITLFGKQLNKIADSCGFYLHDACARFSNPLLKRIFQNIEGYNDYLKKS